MTTSKYSSCRKSNLSEDKIDFPHFGFVLEEWDGFNFAGYVIQIMVEE